jgi:hypothetical protein
MSFTCTTIPKHPFHVGIFGWNMGTNTNTWSPELQGIYGTHGVTPTVEAWMNSIVPQDRKSVKLALKNAMKTGQYDIVFRIRRFNDGGIVRLHGCGRLIRAANNQPLALVGINSIVG